MNKKLEIYFVELIQGKKKGVTAFLMKVLLTIVSWFYQAITHVRNWAFDNGYFKQHKAPDALVISIGNIVAGGTGKTPVSLMLAQEFYKDFRLAILSRGYRSPSEHAATPLVLCQGNGPEYGASFAGDEPYLLAKNLPKAWVFVGKNRRLASHMATKADAQVILLDDGMQHRQVARDYEVVVMDAHDPFGHGYFLPRGFLREGLSSLARADLIILNHVDNRERFQAIKKQIAEFSKAPLIGTQMEVCDILNLQNESIGSLKGKKVGIFCALAKPDHFYRTVQQMGAEIVEHLFLADHSTFTYHELLQFYARCHLKGVHWLVCTEKDVVKLDPALLKNIPIAWIKMRLNVVENLSAWKNFIENAKQDMNKKFSTETRSHSE